MRRSLWRFRFRDLPVWRRAIPPRFAYDRKLIEIVHCHVNWDMDPLVAYLKANPLPKTTCRPNISADAVETITLGMVQARGCSTCRISEATTHDKFQLMKLTLALLSDSDICGLPPACFTSVTITIRTSRANYTWTSTMKACRISLEVEVTLVGNFACVPTFPLKALTRRTPK